MRQTALCKVMIVSFVTETAASYVIEYNDMKLNTVLGFTRQPLFQVLVPCVQRDH